MSKDGKGLRPKKYSNYDTTWSELDFARLLHRLKPNELTQTPRQLEYVAWYKGLTEPEERKAVNFLACQIYNAVHQRIIDRFYVVDALEAACVLLLNREEALLRRGKE